MSNLNRLNLAYYPSFITTKTIHNHPFLLKRENADIVLSAINFGRKNSWFYLISFVIMPDHLHLIIVPKEKNISQAMHSIKSFSSNEINRINNRQGQVWQPSFRDFTIYDRDLLLQKINYIHNNPVRKELVINAIDYELSSANPMHDTDIDKIL